MINFEFFTHLTKQDKTFLLEHSKYIELPSDFTLFTQGEICENILLLEEGSVKLFIHGDSHEMISLYEISKGEQCIINTSSTLSHTNAIATAKTISAIKGWMVPHNISKQLMTQSPSYQEYIFSLFSLKFSALTTLIEDIKFKRLDSRVLDFLNNKNTPIIEITHEELANELGTSRVVISRVLKDLENKEFIKLHRKKIEVL